MLKLSTMCYIVKGTGQKQKLPLHPIRTEQPFQIVVDNIIIELPVTTRGNKYVVVFQDLFMQWLILAASDQKAERIACLMVKEIILFCYTRSTPFRQGDKFTMKDVGKLLGI